MKFSQQIKKVNTNKFQIIKINPKEIKAQYNPDKFKFWKSLHEGPKEEVLNMLYSPHYRFLNHYEEQNKKLKDFRTTSYYKLQKLYGRNDKWIKDKMCNFILLFESICDIGLRKDCLITVLEKPLVKNKYNNNYELFEGHHRLACALFLRKELIKINLI